jgi:hypothetical protein
MGVAPFTRDAPPRAADRPILPRRAESRASTAMTSGEVPLGHFVFRVTCRMSQCVCRLRRSEMREGRRDGGLLGLLALPPAFRRSTVDHGHAARSRRGRASTLDEQQARSSCGTGQRIPHGSGRKSAGVSGSSWSSEAIASGASRQGLQAAPFRRRAALLLTRGLLRASAGWRVGPGRWASYETGRGPRMFSL